MPTLCGVGTLKIKRISTPSRALRWFMHYNDFYQLENKQHLHYYNPHTVFSWMHFQKLPHFNARLNSDGYGHALSFFQCRMRYLCIENKQCIL